MDREMRELHRGYRDEQRRMVPEAGPPSSGENDGDDSYPIMEHELEHLVAELRESDTIGSVRILGTGIVGIVSGYGAIGAISSEDMSTIGRYDCSLYDGHNGDDWWIVPP